MSLTAAICALLVSISTEPARPQLSVEAVGELSLGAGTTRGVRVDGVFGPSINLALPIRDAYWISLALGGRAGTLGGRGEGGTETVSVSSRDGIIDLRVLGHVPIRLPNHLQLRVGPLAGVAVQLARADVLVGSRSQRLSAFIAVEAGARMAFIWRRAVFSFEAYGFFTPGTLPPRFVASLGVGVVLF